MINDPDSVLTWVIPIFGCRLYLGVGGEIYLNLMGSLNLQDKQKYFC